MVNNLAADAGAREKAHLRVRKLRLSKYVESIKALAKRRRNREALGINDLMGNAIKRLLLNAVRANGRTGRALRGSSPKDVWVAGILGFLEKSIALVCTPLSYL